MAPRGKAPADVIGNAVAGGRTYWDVRQPARRMAWPPSLSSRIVCAGFSSHPKSLAIIAKRLSPRLIFVSYGGSHPEHRQPSAQRQQCREC